MKLSSFAMKIVTGGQFNATVLQINLSNYANIYAKLWVGATLSASSWVPHCPPKMVFK